MARQSFNGTAATVAAVVGGLVGLSVALFLRALILNTPAQVRPTTFYWWFVLLSAAGALWGLATQSMKQLERIQGYRPPPLKAPRSPRARRDDGLRPPDADREDPPPGSGA